MSNVIVLYFSYCLSSNIKYEKIKDKQTLEKEKLKSEERKENCLMVCEKWNKKREKKFISLVLFQKMETFCEKFKRAFCLLIGQRQC